MVTTSVSDNPASVYPVDWKTKSVRHVVDSTTSQRRRVLWEWQRIISELYTFFLAVKNETEILTSVAIKIAVLWGVTPCSLV